MQRHVFVLGLVALGIWMFGERSRARAEEAEEKGVVWEYGALERGTETRFYAPSVPRGKPEEVWKALGGKSRYPSPLAYLNLLGSQGWQLVSHSAQSTKGEYGVSTEHWWYLKRPAK